MVFDQLNHGFGIAMALQIPGIPVSSERCSPGQMGLRSVKPAGLGGPHAAAVLVLFFQRRFDARVIAKAGADKENYQPAQ